MNYIPSIGVQYRLMHGYSNDEHQFFYESLIISPSYQIAHKVMTGQVISSVAIDGIYRWDLVLKNYELFGDVFTVPFLKWWDTFGRDNFYSKQEDGSYLPFGNVNLVKNKINKKTLIECLTLTNEKARLEKKHGQRIENWRLGVVSGVHSKWTSQLKDLSKKTYDNLQARTALGILVSKKLKESLYVAENAARGQFPSIDPIESGLRFDYPSIFEYQKVNSKLDVRDKWQRKLDGLYVPKKYARRKVNRLLKKQQNT
jgi:hypothetical protein